jgi:hypothetical protein
MSTLLRSNHLECGVSLSCGFGAFDPIFLPSSPRLYNKWYQSFLHELFGRLISGFRFGHPPFIFAHQTQQYWVWRYFKKFPNKYTWCICRILTPYKLMLRVAIETLDNCLNWVVSLDNCPLLFKQHFIKGPYI